MGEARVRQIGAAARRLLEAGGPDALTMRRLADALGIRAPSLYKHLPDKAALESLVIAAGLAELAETLEAAGDDLAGLASAYRDFARGHPHLYRMMTDRALDRSRLPAGVEERAAQPLLRAAGDEDVARAAWAFAHGMVSLELAGRFPPGADLDAAWRAGIEGLALSVHS